MRWVFLGLIFIASFLLYVGADDCISLISSDSEIEEFDCDMMLTHHDCMKDQFCVGWCCYYTVGSIYRLFRCYTVCPDEPEEEFITFS